MEDHRKELVLEAGRTIRNRLKRRKGASDKVRRNETFQKSTHRLVFKTKRACELEKKASKKNPRCGKKNTRPDSGLLASRYRMPAISHDFGNQADLHNKEPARYKRTVLKEEVAERKAGLP